MKNYDIMKNMCRKMYLAGAGDYWYEDNEIGNDKSLKYKFLSGILLFFIVFVTVLEIIAVIFGDLPPDENSDAVTFAVSHTIVIIKIFSVMVQRKKVKELNRQIVEICKDYEDEGQVAKNNRIIKINTVACIMTVYGSAIFFVFEGIRKELSGSHFITVVTFWPFHEDNSVVAQLFRVFTTLVLYVMMATMISIDSFALVTLIMYKYKFITLRHYLEGLRAQFDRNNYKGNEEYATDQLKAGLLEWIVMHRNLKRLSKDIDQSVGTVLTAQVCLSSGSAVSLLLQLALSTNLSFGTAMKIILYVIAVFFLLGLFLCNAGEITYQASLLSESIFYCGWHACPMRGDLRRLVLMACASAQRPIVMKAFKMLELTYATYVQVARTTYSVFALFYTQNK